MYVERGSCEDRLRYRGQDPWYCEIAITGKCNFKCAYCNRFNADVDLKRLYAFFDSVSGFRHIQITGGEPTKHFDFLEIMRRCRSHSLQLGLSTNGSAETSLYQGCGATRFSISLDDYDFGILRTRGYVEPELVVHNIKSLAKTHYVDVGIVVDGLNVDRIEDIVDYALSLGVADVKLSSSTRGGRIPVFEKTYESYPILSYRVQRFRLGLDVRGSSAVPTRCGIARNDVTIVGGDHYPCLVYFREGGRPIGAVSSDLMEQRRDWSLQHDCSSDPVCVKYCMDFKCAFNNALRDVRE